MKKLFCEHASYILSGDESAKAADRIMDVVESYLGNAKAKRVQRDGDQISFSGGMLRLVTKFNPLYCVTGGEVWLERDDDSYLLHYRIWFNEMAVFATILAFPCIVAAAVMSLMGISTIGDMSAVKGAAIAVLGWLFIVVGAVLGGTWRFDSFMCHCIRQAGAEPM